MGQSILKEILSESFVFDYRRAIYWPEQKLLMAADLHWGKTQYFRQHGIAISDDIFEADLARLASLFEDYETRTFLVLGDLIHHEKSLRPSLIERVSWFRHEYPCELILLKGNHDRYTRFPESWGIMEENDFSFRDFTFSHDHNPKLPGFQFSGHVHPMIRLSAGFDSLKLPAFVITKKHCLLPAFSGLTGGQDLKLQKGEEAFVLTDVGIEVFRR